MYSVTRSDMIHKNSKIRNRTKGSAPDSFCSHHTKEKAGIYNMEKDKHIIGIIITLVGGTFWGLSGTCGQYLFLNKASCSDWLVPVRLLCAGAILILFYLITDHDTCLKPWKHKKSAITLLCYGILGMMLCQYSYFRAIEASNAGTATVLQYISPVLIMLVMCIREKRMPRLIDIFCVLLALSGIFLLATHGHTDQLVVSGAALFWGLFSAVTVVFYNLIPRGLMRIYPTPMLLGWAMFIGGAILFLLRKPWLYHPVLDAGALACLAFIIPGGTIAAFSLYMLGVKYIGPEKASLYACVEPLAATVFSFLWLKVPFTAMDILGFILIMSTIFLLTLFGKAAPRSQKP